MDGPAPTLDAAPNIDDSDLPRWFCPLRSFSQSERRFLRVVATPAEKDDVGRFASVRDEMVEWAGEKFGQRDV